MGEDRIIKSSFLLRVKKFEKIVGEDGSIQLKNISNIYDTHKGKEIQEQIWSTHIPVQYVAGEPDQFQFNILYIRSDGKTGWLYVLNEESNI